MHLFQLRFNYSCYTDGTKCTYFYGKIAKDLHWAQSTFFVSLVIHNLSHRTTQSTEAASSAKGGGFAFQLRVFYYRYYQSNLGKALFLFIYELCPVFHKKSHTVTKHNHYTLVMTSEKSLLWVQFQDYVI